VADVDGGVAGVQVVTVDTDGGGGGPFLRCKVGCGGCQWWLCRGMRGLDGHGECRRQAVLKMAWRCPTGRGGQRPKRWCSSSSCPVIVLLLRSLGCSCSKELLRSVCLSGLLPINVRCLVYCPGSLFLYRLYFFLNTMRAYTPEKNASKCTNNFVK
jgi:hypothetical protein